MKDERKTEIKVGITVALAILLLVALVSWAKNISLSASRKHLVVQFVSVSGLEVGDLVTLNGVRKGYVDGIINNGKKGVLVDLSLDTDISLREDAKISVDMLDLMGGKKVEIDQGNSDALLDLTKVAKGDFSADVPLVMKTAGTIVNEMPGIIFSLNETLSSVKSIVKDEDMNRNIRTTIKELTEVTKKLNVLVGQNSASITSLVANSNKLVNETNVIVQENKANVKESLQGLKELTKNSTALIERLDGIISETQQQKNNVGKIMYDAKLVPDMKELVTSLKEMVSVLNEQLKKNGVNVRAKIDLF